MRRTLDDLVHRLLVDELAVDEVVDQGHGRQHVTERELPRVALLRRHGQHVALVASRTCRAAARRGGVDGLLEGGPDGRELGALGQDGFAVGQERRLRHERRRRGKRQRVLVPGGSADRGRGGSGGGCGGVVVGERGGLDREVVAQLLRVGDDGARDLVQQTHLHADHVTHGLLSLDLLVETLECLVHGIRQEN